MAGKVCVVTGANAGIGRATALALARMGARVGMVSRSRERGEAARAEVVRESGSAAVDLFLANLLFTRELARRTVGRGVTTNAAHPGVVGTELLFGGWAPLRLLKRFMRTPEEGASVVVRLASAPELGGVTGRYFREEGEIRPSAAALDDEAARRLWRVSEEMTGLAPS